MRKTAIQTLASEGERVFKDIKKLAHIVLMHPDPAVRKEAAYGASKLLKILTALGITGVGVGGGLAAANRNPIPGISDTLDSSAILEEDYGPLDFDALLQEQLPEYAAELNQETSVPAGITPEDFAINEPGTTENYDRNQSNVEMLLNELESIDRDMGSNTLSQENVDDITMKRDALLQRLAQTGSSRMPDEYNY